MTRLPAGISGKRAPAAATTVKGAQFGENRVLQPTFFKRGVQATHFSFSILQRAQSPETTGVAGRCEQGWVQMQPSLLSPACNCMPRKPGRNAAPNCAPPRYTRKDTQRPEKPAYADIVSVGRKPPFRTRQKSPIIVNLKKPTNSQGNSVGTHA